MRKKYFVGKLIISLLIIITLFNFIYSSGFGAVVLADDDDAGVVASSLQERLDTIISTRTNGLVDTIAWVVTSAILMVFGMFQSVIYALASSGGLNSTDVSSFITPLDIFFNKFTLVDINIFSTTDGLGNQLDTSSLVYKLRTTAAFWYFIVRAIALGISFIMFLINLIKVLSTNSTIQQKTVAKKTLSDWGISIVLVFFMHVLIVFIVNANEILVGIISGVAGATDVSTVMLEIENICISSSYILRTAALVVYALMIYQTVKYLLIYIQRFLTCIFLTIISPIIPVFYSTEKSIGNRSVALNGWFREFVYNVFLQSLHALIYVVIVSLAMTALASNTTGITQVSDLADAMMAIILLFFVSHAERLLKDLLGFNKAVTVSNNVLQTAYNGAKTAAAISIAAATGVPMSTGIQFGQNINANTGNANANLGSGQFGSTFATGFNNIRNRVSSAWDNLTNGSNPQDTMFNDVSDNITLDSGSVNQDETSTSGPEVLVGAVVDNTEAERDINNNNSTLLNERINNFREVVESTHRTSDKETIETYVPVDSEDDSVIEIGNNPELVEEFKKAFKNLIEQDNIVQAWGADIDQKLDELDALEAKLSEEDAKKIEDDITNMKSPDEMNAYIDKLGRDTAEGKFAAAFADWQSYSALTDEVGDKKKALIDEYRGKGLKIDDDLAEKLLRYDGENILNRTAASGITTKLSANNDTALSANEVERVEGEVINSDEVIDMPDGEVENAIDVNDSTELADMVKDNKEVQESAMDAMSLINVINGNVEIDGEAMEGSVNKFSIKVSKKLQQGSYSQSNFDAAMQRVKNEGNAAVKSLEAYRNNPTASNAKALSPAGKEFAQLQIEAQHAGFMITEATAVQTNKVQVSHSEESDMQMRQAIVRDTVLKSFAAAAATQTSTDTQNVINGLNNRRKAQNG